MTRAQSLAADKNDKWDEQNKEPKGSRRLTQIIPALERETTVMTLFIASLGGRGDNYIT